MLKCKRNLLLISYHVQRASSLFWDVKGLLFYYPSSLYSPKVINTAMLSITTKSAVVNKRIKTKKKRSNQNQKKYNLIKSCTKNLRRHLLPVVISAFPILVPLHSSLVLPIGSYIEPREHPALPPVQ